MSKLLHIMGRRPVVLGLLLLCLLGLPLTVAAATQTDSQSVNVTAVVPGPPPTTPATITSPTNNTVVAVTPLVVSGTCGPGLEVRLYDNTTQVGSTICALDGTFSINMSLNVGANNLTVLNFDTLNQPGPASPTVVVTVVIPSTGSTPGGGPAKSYRNYPSSPGTSTTPPTTQPPEPTSPGISIPGLHYTITLVRAIWLLFIILTTALIFIIDILFNKRRLTHLLFWWRRKQTDEQPTE